MTIKKKKILFRINTLRGGGAEKVLITILKHINYNKYDIELLVNKKGYVYDSQVPSHVNFKYLFKSSNILSKHKVLYKIIRELALSLINAFPQLLYKFNILGRYDIEVAFLEDMAPFTVKSPNKKSKKIAWIHIDLLGLETLNNVTKKKICQSLIKFDKIIVVSNRVGDALLQLCANLGLNTNQIEAKIETIYNPIDVEDIIRKCEDYSPTIKQNVPLLIGVGTLSIQKKFDRLIEAHKKLLQNSIPNKVLILGEGPMRKELELLITKLSVQDSVQLLGFIPNPYPYISKANIFVLSSDHEGYPLVLTEALVLEKPVIATSITGSTEMLKNGEYGMLVEPSAEGLYIGLKELLSKKNLYEQHILKAKAGKLQFNCQQKINEIEQVLDTY